MLQDSIRQALKDLGRARGQLRQAVEAAGDRLPDLLAAEALLAELRAEEERIRAGFRGQVPAPLANMLADALAIAEGYVASRRAEAARGWDARELLRGMVRSVRRCVENVKRAHAAVERDRPWSRLHATRPGSVAPGTWPPW